MAIDLSEFYSNLNGTVAMPENFDGHFDVIRVEDLSLPNGKPARYSKRTYYKISLITGHSKIHYADTVFEISGTTLLFTNPKIPYSWERISEEQTGYVCLFTDDFFKSFGNIAEYPVFKFPQNAIVSLDVETSKRYDCLFSQIRDELRSAYRFRYDLLRSMTMQLIHEIQKHQTEEQTFHNNSNSHERIAKAFSDLLEAQFPIVVSSQQLKIYTPAVFAEKLNIHVNHLNKALKSTSGKTTSESINNRIIMESVNLLKNTNWTISEIAWCMGFEQPQHFTSFFKKVTRLSPKEYRKHQMD